MGKFKVGDKVRFVEDFGSYRKGDVVEIADRNVYRGEQTVDFKGVNGKGNTYITRIELVTNKQRIATLENELSEVKNALAEQIKWNDEQKRFNDTVIEKLRLLFDNVNVGKPSAVIEEALANDIIEFEGAQYRKVEREAREGDVVVCNNQTDSDETPIENGVPYEVGAHNMFAHDDINLYNRWHNRTPETVDVYKRIMPSTVGKTANELRGEIIEKAKGFVDENGGDDYHFEVFEDKRAVVAWKIEDKVSFGDALCSADTVFNEHIQRAIAFGKAEGLDVSEFEQAVQPTFAVGQIIKTQKSKLENATIYTIEKLGEHRNDLSYEGNSKQKNTAHSGGLDDFYTIINDTNAIYSGGVE